MQELKIIMKNIIAPSENDIGHFFMWCALQFTIDQKKNQNVHVLNGTVCENITTTIVMKNSFNFYF